jgi:hypothetical protein
VAGRRTSTRACKGRRPCPIRHPTCSRASGRNSVRRPAASTSRRLRLALDLAGHSSGSQPRQHYVVETDPETGWDEEIARWYRDEHMPGLAAVPGCILAQRYDNLDGGPRSLACYDLVTADTLGSPPWLAVRHTEWSSRTRPHFTNTRRTMMDVVA